MDHDPLSEAGIIDIARRMMGPTRDARAAALELATAILLVEDFDARGLADLLEDLARLSRIAVLVAS